MSKFVMFVGLPGSGKTTLANAIMACASKPTAHLSSDAIREELWGDANDQKNPGKVFEVMKNRAIEYLDMGWDVIYDATNIVAKQRKSTLTAIRNAVDEDFLAQCVFISCPLSECKRRQGDRERKVPVEVIDRMVRQFETPWYNEGWDQINIAYGSPKKQNIDREHWRMLGESHDNPHHTASLEMHCALCEGNMRRAAEEAPRVGKEAYRMLAEAGYQHDLGKHKTKAFFDTKGNPTDIAHYYSHNNVGAYLWLTGDKDREWTNSEFLYIALLIQLHMMPYAFPNRSKEELDKWCAKQGYDETISEWVWWIHEADKAAH